MLQCGAKNVNPLERFCRRCPLLPSYLSYLLPSMAHAGVIKCADRGREINLAAAAMLAHPGINGKIILLEPRRLARVTLRNDWRSCLTKSQAIPLLPDACAKLRRAEYPPGSGYQGVLTRMIQRDPELSGVGLVSLMNFMSAACRRIWRWRCYSCATRSA